MITFEIIGLNGGEKQIITAKNKLKFMNWSVKNKKKTMLDL